MIINYRRLVGFSKEVVERMLEFNGVDKKIFWKYIQGHTCGISPNTGEAMIYLSDLERFISSETKNPWIFIGDPRDLGVSEASKGLIM